MRLSAKAIGVYNSVNSYSYANQWITRAGDANTLYFQIFDLDQGPSNTIAGLSYGNYPTSPLSANIGLRYLVGLGLMTDQYNINVTFPSINSALTVVLAATQVSSADASIWSVSVPSAAQLNGGNVLFAVTENTVTKSFSVTNLVAVEFPLSSGSC